MNGRFFLRLFLALVLIAGLVGLGMYIFNAGMMQGAAGAGRIVVPDGAPVMPYYRGYHMPMGFGLFGWIGPLLGLFLFFGLLRLIFFRRGPGHWGRHMNWGEKHPEGSNGIPPMVEEWHKKMHEAEPKPAEDKKE